MVNSHIVFRVNTTHLDCLQASLNRQDKTDTQSIHTCSVIQLITVLYHHSLNTPKSKPCITIAMYVLCIQPISPVAPAVSDSVCTEWTLHDSLHPTMLHGMTEMLYTVSGSSEVT